jgi:tRNA-splicing ligase RtcB
MALREFDGIPVFGDPVDQDALKQIKNCKRDADYVALMGDHHKGYGCPIGGVVASTDKIAPGSVGFDIACGNKAVRLDLKYRDINRDLPKIADAIWQALSFGVGRSNSEKVDHALFDSPAWTDVPFLKSNRGLKDSARAQLGTIGSGNHYCDVFKDEENRIWVGVHFGSRGLGHRIATEFIKLAGGNPNGSMEVAPNMLEVGSTAGEEYLAAMELAGQYAYAGRDWVTAKVASILGAPIVEEIHNHHNFAWRETHFGQDLWVVRKGATPAAPGQKGFVGGSMGDQSVILEGVDSEESARTMYSTVHGAGRVMSRTQAAGKGKWVSGRIVRVSPGVVDMERVREKLKKQGIQLRGAGADEAPQVYKRLPEVLAHHGETVRVLHTLDPVIVCMAGEDEFDPFKD